VPGPTGVITGCALDLRNAGGPTTYEECRSMNTWMIHIVLATWLIASTAQAQQQPSVHAIRAGDLHGLIDGSGRLLVPAEFVEIQMGDPLILVRKGSKTAYVDRQGKMVIAPQEKLHQPFAEGLTPAHGLDAQGKHRWGYADQTGVLVIRPAYESAEGFVDGVAVVSVSDEWGATKLGAIDRSGKLVVPAIHDKLLPAGGGLVRAESKGRTHRVYDRTGRDLTPEGVDFIGLAREGMVRVWQGRQQGFMSVDGRLVVAPRFAQASDFHEGMARVWVEGKYGYIDKSGAMVVPPRFESGEEFADGLALVKEGGRSLFIDRTGAVVLTPEADRVWPFAEGLAAFRAGKLHGYMDKTGKTVIAPQFSVARAFQGGLAYVVRARTESTASVSGYIRRDGEMVWQEMR